MHSATPAVHEVQPIYVRNVCSTRRSKICIRQFISQPKSHLRMLEHVVEAEILHFVFGSVDLMVGVLKIGFDHKCRGIAVPTSRSMVRTSIPTLC